MKKPMDKAPFTPEEVKEHLAKGLTPEEMINLYEILRTWFFANMNAMNEDVKREYTELINLVAKYYLENNT